jgi:hypothetical protein
MSKQSDPTDQAMWDAFNAFHFQCDRHRFQKLYARADLVRLIADVPGDIVDAGVYKGTSTIEFAHLLETYQPHGRSRVIAFDTFEEEFPHARDDERGAVTLHQKSFEGSAYETLVGALERVGLSHRVEVVKGDILETFPRYLEVNPGLRISLLHCDLDTYRPTLEMLRHGWRRITPGGIAAFDEYAVAMWGESDAVDEFFSDFSDPPPLKTLEASPTPTAYCVKRSNKDLGDAP